MSATNAENLSTYLSRLGRRRKTRTVTADDAHKFFDRTGVEGVTARISAINSVLNANNEQIVVSGTTVSERPVAKGRSINVWRYI